VGTTFPNRRLRPALCFLLFCGAFAQGAPGDSSAATYRTSAAEVSLTFTATDQNHGVATLQERDFAVVDREIIVRNFRSFNRVEMTGLDLAVLIDASESVAPRFRQEIANAVQIISRTNGVPDESFSVASFHGLEPRLICAGNCRAADATDQILALQAGGLTPLFDSIVFASDLLQQRADRHAKKVLILFSDGDDTISRHSAADAVEAALAGNIQIYTVDLRPAPGATPGASLLRSLASVTGGRAFTLQQGAAAVTDAVLEDYHATYVVTYKLPTHAAGFHEVRILPTHNLNLQLRCRRGYYYPDNGR